jgi:predicted porin
MMKILQTWFISAAVVVIASANFVSAAQLLFTPRVSVTEEYNDNIDLDRKNKKDDFITIVSVGGTLEWLGQVSGLRLSYDPAYAFYADNDTYDSWRHSFNGTAWHNFSRETRLDLINYFIYTKDPLGDDGVEDSQGKIIVQGNDRNQKQSTYKRNYASARLNHQFGPEDSTYAQFSYGLTKYDDPTSEDSQEFSPSAGLIYWFSNWWGMELDGGYTRGLYDESDSSDFNNYSGRLRINRRISQQFGVYGEYRQIYRTWDDPRQNGGGEGNDIEEDYLVYAPSAGLFYQFDPTLTASLGAGYFYQQIENSKDQKGPFFSTDINKLWDYQSWSIRTRASSGLDSQDFSGDNQGFERFAQAEIIGRYDFTRELFGDCSLRYRYSDFLNSEDNEVDHRYTADVGLGYSLTRWMTLRLAYQFNKLDAINSTDDYDQHRVYATLTLEPDQPWRLWD